MYSYRFTNQISITSIVEEMLAAEEEVDKCDNELLNILIEKTKEKSEDFDVIIANHLDDGWSLNRIEIVLVIIIELAICEMMFLPEIALRTIIDEYTTITTYFGNHSEVNFVNAILDRIGKKIRAD